MTEWRPVGGYEGWYEVSDEGRVRRVAGGKAARPGRLLTAHAPPRRYVRVTLSRHAEYDRRYAHQLVAEAFLDPCPPGHEVNHKNGIKADNRAANLEWATRSQNRLHAERTGLAHTSERTRGEGHRDTPFTEEQVRAIRRRSAAGEASKALAREYGVRYQSIQAIVHRRSWRHIDS